jgi:hypothetical protein
VHTAAGDTEKPRPAAASDPRQWDNGCLGNPEHEGGRGRPESVRSAPPCRKSRLLQKWGAESWTRTRVHTARPGSSAT